jgi:hypothetical protein
MAKMPASMGFGGARLVVNPFVFSGNHHTGPTIENTWFGPKSYQRRQYVIVANGPFSFFPGGFAWRRLRSVEAIVSR